jgi:hypothetical protein
MSSQVSANYETKNTSTFQLFHCQQTQSLLITLHFSYYTGFITKSTLHFSRYVLRKLF